MWHTLHVLFNPFGRFDSVEELFIRDMKLFFFLLFFAVSMPGLFARYNCMRKRQLARLVLEGSARGWVRGKQAEAATWEGGCKI